MTKEEQLQEKLGEIQILNGMLPIQLKYHENENARSTGSPKHDGGEFRKIITLNPSEEAEIKNDFSQTVVVIKQLYDDINLIL